MNEAISKPTTHNQQLTMKTINTFWNWFQDNNQTIRNSNKETPKNQTHILYWLDKNLKYYSKEIGFMLVLPNNPSEIAELIITANGNPDNFRKVIDLVDNAPKLRTWKFSALIKPSKDINELMEGIDEPYVVREITLKARELKFLPLEYKEETQPFEIIIHLKNHLWLCNTQTVVQTLYNIIKHPSIEKSISYNNNFVHLAQRPDQEENLIHLFEWQCYIHSIHNR